MRLGNWFFMIDEDNYILYYFNGINYSMNEAILAGSQGYDIIGVTEDYILIKVTTITNTIWYSLNFDGPTQIFSCSLSDTSNYTVVNHFLLNLVAIERTNPDTTNKEWIRFFGYDGSLIGENIVSDTAAFQNSNLYYSGDNLVCLYTADDIYLILYINGKNKVVLEYTHPNNGDYDRAQYDMQSYSNSRYSNSGTNAFFIIFYNNGQAYSHGTFFVDNCDILPIFDGTTSLEHYTFNLNGTKNKALSLYPVLSNNMAYFLCCDDTAQDKVQLLVMQKDNGSYTTRIEDIKDPTTEEDIYYSGLGSAPITSNIYGDTLVMYIPAKSFDGDTLYYWLINVYDTQGNLAISEYSSSFDPRNNFANLSSNTILLIVENTYYAKVAQVEEVTEYPVESGNYTYYVTGPFTTPDRLQPGNLVQIREDGSTYIMRIFSNEIISDPIQIPESSIGISMVVGNDAILYYYRDVNTDKYCFILYDFEGNIYQQQQYDNPPTYYSVIKDRYLIVFEDAPNITFGLITKESYQEMTYTGINEGNTFNDYTWYND